MNEKKYSMKRFTLLCLICTFLIACSASETHQTFVPEPELTKQQLLSGALDAHNSVRAKHGLNPLKWSNELASYSQEWADHLGKGQTCQMYHRTGQPQFGEICPDKSQNWVCSYNPPGNFAGQKPY